MEQNHDLTESIIAHVRDMLNERQTMEDKALHEYIEHYVFQQADEHRLTSMQMKWMIDRTYNAFRGLDVLQPLIDDPSITEIMINGYDEIFIEQDGRIFKSDVQFESSEKLEDIIQMIVGRVNRTVNASSPIVDARLQDGSRVNVVLPPIALKGPTMTIRKFPEKPLTINDLVEKDSISEEVADFLKKLVLAKYNIFISGGTGSGKTTFLNVLSNFIPKSERIITIEDSAELQIKSVPNLVSLETRNANTEGKGEITIRDLIKSSLRMRPDRIVVGEVRGVEALDMLQAMNTGHDGSLSTGHSNSIEDMLSRLETMVLSGANFPIPVIRQQISSAVDIMVHLSRLRDHSRKVVAVSEVIGVEDGEVQLSPLYEFVEEGDGPVDRVIGSLKPTGETIQNRLKLEMSGIKL
ncbi:pilus assembly protein CpaF [Gracilibacillus orientalis]|uniref:Pilus assembly protein CpaF n=1 Tax=Gracilibacillus orientalis TaxID=334253 RepID=A0A1I4P5P9_9BACI|nr:CpaF family protein [Gracilibacillus orientalis]SFM23102.1 pilus assembly protein CpaF [Gracilibacillus orientalis]